MPDSVIFPGQELSLNCSEVVTFVEGVGLLGKEKGEKGGEFEKIIY